ncbi:39S ribosomal protein L52, mitochondrial-like [Haliotis rubra]|uniref:39S ribosomal protein L52, mitochondrial-like n=1 Tax=Haliotis rubra TaxID=36100 RepID=UPI001EE6072D|nr:39S ribosomal protein L52, mitochondrial-like [Haliotis rubra]
MACLKCASLLNVCKGVQGSFWNATGLRWFQTSVPVTAGQKWRLEQGLAADNTRYGPLTDMPDYSYLDGRPTPLSKGQVQRRRRRIGIAKRIKFLVGEMNEARENYALKQKEEVTQNEEAVKKRLKPKTDQ